MPEEKGAKKVAKKPPRKPATRAARKRRLQSVLSQKLGKPVTEIMMKELEKMVKRGEPISAIKKKFEELLENHMEKVRRCPIDNIG